MTALSGVRVLELSESVAGEYFGKLLADFGAELIKLEKPGTGSPTRRLGPFAREVEDPERSGLFAYLNTNKRSVEADLASDTGRALLAQLLERVDVIVDDHVGDWLSQVGLDPQVCAEQHPELVLCSITPFGRFPSAERQHAQDLTVFQNSGWGYHTPSGAKEEQPPLKGAGRFMASYEAGLEGALCVLASLVDRQQGRRGRFIEISNQAVLASRADYVLAQMVAGDLPVNNSRHAFDLAGPAGIFACREGYAYIWMSAPAHWEGLRQLLADPAWMKDFPENWLERECTPERVATCRRELAGWLATQDKNEAAAAAQSLGVTLVPVNDPSDLLASPQYQYRKYFTKVDHPVQGNALYPTVPYRLSETPAVIRSAAPLLGEHNRSARVSAADKPVDGGAS